MTGELITPAAAQIRYLEDITVGGIEETRPILVEEEDMIRFAKHWDPMPFHVDRDLAAQSIFGAITASSVYTIGVKQLLAKQLLSEAAVVCMLGFDEGRLPQPLYGNREVRLKGTWLEKRESRSRPDCGILRFKIELITDHNETVLDYVETVLIRRRPC